MSQTRREALQGLLGASWVGLRAVATGLPVGLLLDPRGALATGSQNPASRGRFLVLSLSTCGDPLNANVPGSYAAPDIVHPVDPRFSAAPLLVAGQRHQAAQSWKQLPQKLLDRTVFFHHATLQNSHPGLPDLLQVGSPSESAPVLFASELSKPLDTVQSQPLMLGADEVLTVADKRLPGIRPTELRDALLGPSSPLPQLAKLRQDTIARLSYLRHKTGNAQLDRALRTQTMNAKQAQQLGEQLAADLAAIKGDGADAQVIAAAIAVRLGISPIIAIHIPMGGDNHFDGGLKQEADQIHSGIGHIAALWNKLTAYGVAERSCFAHLSVFGRTLRRDGLLGRDHWPLHNTALLMGAPFRGGVVGGVVAQAGDYAAQAIDSRTGQPSPGGDIQPSDSGQALLRTLAQGIGVDSAVLAKTFPTGKPVRQSLA